jgi:hypothetical protein
MALANRQRLTMAPSEIMTLVVPQLDMSPGRIICLHVPHGFHNEVPALEQEVVQLAKRFDKSVALCRPAEIRRGIREYFRQQRSRVWLAQSAGISEEEAARIIANFGVRVGDILSANAATPRCLLGIAATLCRKPQVIVYSTSGLDPSGCIAVHRFVELNRSDSCAIHLSLPALFGNGSPAPRLCPDNAQCAALTPAEDSALADNVDS